MLRSRVLLTVLALLAVPFVASAAQGRGKEKVRSQSESSLACTPEQAAALERARAAGHQVPFGLANKNCEVTPPAPPPPPSPPSGPHRSVGIVYEDVDADGNYQMFAGDVGLMGWTVELYWNGQLIASTSSDALGNYAFNGLGNATYSVCVIGQAGFVRTEPANGDACGGAGSTFTLSNSFETWAEQDFGMFR